MNYSFLSILICIFSVGTVFAQLPDHRKEHEKPKAERKHHKHAHTDIPSIPGWVHVHVLDTEFMYYIKPTEITLLDWSYFLLDKYKVEKISSEAYTLALPERNEINNRFFYNTTELQALWDRSVNATNLTPAFVKEILTKKGVANLPVTGITMVAANEYMKYVAITYKGTGANGIHNEFDKAFDIHTFQMSVTLPTTAEYRLLLSNFKHNNMDSLSYKSMLTRGYDEHVCPLFNATMPDTVMKSKCPALQPASELITKYGRPGKMVYPVGSYPADPFGLFDIRGNVSEMTTTEGVGMGGGYRTLAESCGDEYAQAYTRTATWLGFRPVMLLKKKAN